MMSVTLYYVVLAVSSIVAKSGADILKLGDACILEKSGEAGECVSLKDCRTAKLELRFGKRPQICLYEGAMPVVCCDQAGNMTTPMRFRSRNPRTANYRNRSCGEMPPGSVKVQKKGQKSWDKCIDLAESVHPCIRSSPLIGAKLIRSNECAQTASALVFGGQDANVGEFPHMAAVGLGDTNFPADIHWYCGGSLISELWVLTAAHCLYVDSRPVSHVHLGGGNLNIPPTKENLYTVVLPLKHPNYIRPSKYNDIGLLKLDRWVTFHRTVRPGCLHTGEPVSDERVLVTGWGATKRDGSKSDILQKTVLEKFTFLECNATFGKDKSYLMGLQNDTQICYGHRTKRQDTCKGDSGGPLQIDNKDRVGCTYLIIGVTSTGKICGEPGFPAIYTRVSAYLPWIEQNVWPDN